MFINLYGRSYQRLLITVKIADETKLKEAQILWEEL